MPSAPDLVGSRSGEISETLSNRIENWKTRTLSKFWFRDGIMCQTQERTQAKAELVASRAYWSLLEPIGV